MRLRSGFGYACKVVGVVLFALALSACRQPQQPKEYGLGDAGPVTSGSPQDFAAAAGDAVHFEAGSAALSSEAQAVLRNQIRWLNRHTQYQVTIEGHTDEPDTREFNLALGARRALAVKHFLLRNGLSARRIHTVSYGKERPIAVCDDISCWSQNRRAQTRLTRAVAAY